MATLQLSDFEARLVFLAVQYHLARPGSELDPETGGPREHGLAEVGRALEPQLEQAVAEIELSEYQRGRLISAVAGTVNELKAYPLLDVGRSMVPGFDEAMRRLFPEVAEEPDEASEAVERLLALRRRLEGLAPPPTRGPDPRSLHRPWWRFWRRG